MTDDPIGYNRLIKKGIYYIKDHTRTIDPKIYSNFIMYLEIYRETSRLRIQSASILLPYKSIGPLIADFPSAMD